MRFAIPILAVVVLAVGARPAAAGESVDAELTVAAADVAKYLKALDAKSVAVGQIRSTADEKISHGPGLALRLNEKLAAAGLKVEKGARYLIVGEYADKKDVKSGRVFIQLDLTVTDATNGGKKLLPLRRAIFGEDALIELLAPAAIAIPPGTHDDKREEVIVRAIDTLRTKPSWVIDGTTVYASAEKEYGVEFLVKGADGKFAGRVPKEDDGDLVIELKKGESFRIHLYNRSRYEAGAKVLIDGLSTFSFGAFQKMEAKPRWLVPAGKGVEVLGWPTGDNKSHEFLVTDYAGSAVAELGGDATKLGVLTVEFAAAWAKDGTPPADEGDLKGAKGAVGVGRGAEIATPTTKVERVFGRTRATISLRYNK
jgi:hypothetical protein